MLRIGNFWLVASLAATIAIAAPATAGGQACLSEFERKIERDHADVSAITLQDLDAIASQGRQLLLLDIRDHSEFEVSHIKGAIRVDPDITAEAFQARFGEAASGKVIVLYCSVGVRSSRLARRIDNVARESGASGVYNLRGGVFHAHNANRLLHNAFGTTRYVHPYNWYWRGYLDRTEDSRFTPARQ